VTWGRRWYLVAWDIDRDDWRTFRVDRIGDVQPTAGRFGERRLPAEDMTAYIAGNVARAGWTYQLSVRLHAPADVVHERINPAIGEVTPIDATTCLLTTGTDDLWSSAVYIGMLGFDFEVDGPPELIDYLSVLAGRYTRAAATG
jgi:predicted DNA-binding transcriptional regulator YafY